MGNTLTTPPAPPFIAISGPRSKVLFPTNSTFAFLPPEFPTGLHDSAKSYGPYQAGKWGRGKKNRKYYDTGIPIYTPVPGNRKPRYKWQDKGKSKRGGGGKGYAYFDSGQRDWEGDTATTTTGPTSTATYGSSILSEPSIERVPHKRRHSGSFPVRRPSGPRPVFPRRGTGVGRRDARSVVSDTDMGHVPGWRQIGRRPGGMMGMGVGMGGPYGAAGGMGMERPWTAPAAYPAMGGMAMGMDGGMDGMGVGAGGVPAYGVPATGAGAAYPGTVPGGAGAAGAAPNPYAYAYVPQHQTGHPGAAGLGGGIPPANHYPQQQQSQPPPPHYTTNRPPTPRGVARVGHGPYVPAAGADHGHDRNRTNKRAPISRDDDGGNNNTSHQSTKPYHSLTSLDACICTTNCTCRKGHRVVYFEDRDDGSGPLRGEIRYVLRDDLGKDCGDHSACFTREGRRKGTVGVEEKLGEVRREVRDGLREIREAVAGGGGMGRAGGGGGGGGNGYAVDHGHGYPFGFANGYPTHIPPPGYSSFPTGGAGMDDIYDPSPPDFLHHMHMYPPPPNNTGAGARHRMMVPPDFPRSRPQPPPLGRPRGGPFAPPGMGMRPPFGRRGPPAPPPGIGGGMGMGMPMGRMPPRGGPGGGAPEGRRHARPPPPGGGRGGGGGASGFAPGRRGRSGFPADIEDNVDGGGLGVGMGMGMGGGGGGGDRFGDVGMGMGMGMEMNGGDDGEDDDDDDWEDMPDGT
ncbi:uncharacterized protein EI97DRAFT_307966 [Westerdykella ornata]|uniref:Uncharacterized protein n=1 Tax=Westerdykella ornata TaxID=318751 RepID=A0A6A6JKD6_WESOR|nr:uncharacterized protein EI97DRAFT_307966 [Westerdykella ornata]KAF2277061.1 hypothetical protein EI97DRAFT_307966 [Westerdykella ornata]